MSHFQNTSALLIKDSSSTFDPWRYSWHTWTSLEECLRPLLSMHQQVQNGRAKLSACRETPLLIRNRQILKLLSTVIRL
jgi:hypothetical protein